MPERHHHSYSTLRSWKTICDPARIAVILSSRGGLRSIMITIVIGTPLLMAVVMSIHWATRDKRPYLVVNRQDMEVSLPRLEIHFPVGDPSYTFVHELFSVRGGDEVSEFNLVHDIGLNETSRPILRTLGRHSSFAKLGQTLQFAGLQFTERKTSC